MLRLQCEIVAGAMAERVQVMDDRNGMSSRRMHTNRLRGLGVGAWSQTDRLVDIKEVVVRATSCHDPIY